MIGARHARLRELHRIGDFPQRAARDRERVLGEVHLRARALHGLVAHAKLFFGRRPRCDDAPVAIRGDTHVEAVELVRNRLEQRDGRLVAVATEERETLECGLVFRSVGYLGVAVPDLPFDERRGTIRNAGGRVVGDDGEPVGRVYCAGWIKRGPTGIIGTNKKDATETVTLLLEDVDAGRLEHRDDVTADAVETVLADRGVRAVLYTGWTSIDDLERAAGEKLGRPRVKLRTWDELLDAAEHVAETTA